MLYAYLTIGALLTVATLVKDHDMRETLRTDRLEGAMLCALIVTGWLPVGVLVARDWLRDRKAAR
jgi:hypothetical protein